MDSSVDNFVIDCDIADRKKTTNDLLVVMATIKNIVVAADEFLYENMNGTAIHDYLIQEIKENEKQ